MSPDSRGRSCRLRLGCGSGFAATRRGSCRRPPRSCADRSLREGSRQRHRPARPLLRAPHWPSSCRTNKRFRPKPQFRPGRFERAATRLRRPARQRSRSSRIRGAFSAMMMPPGTDAILERMAKLAETLHVVWPRGKGSSEGQRRGNVLRAPAVALLLSADRLERGQSFTSSTPMPGGPPSLCAHAAMKSASGKRHLARALRAVGQKQRSRGSRPSPRSAQRLDHAGLVVHLLDRNKRWAACQDFVESIFVDQPVRSDRNDLRSASHRVAARSHVRSRLEPAQERARASLRSRWPRSRRW